jgi:hypothetical protein
MNVDRVIFDDSKLQEQDVLRWFRLSPTVAAYNGYLVPPSISDCPVKDRRYVDCGKRPVIPLPANAQVNIARIEAVLEDLRNGDYPVELEEPRAYLTEVQEFFLWRNKVLFEFMGTGKPEVLEAVRGSLDPSTSCEAVLGKIRAEPTAEGRFRLASVDWANCVWNAELPKLGDYPKEAWQKFLAKYSIREEPIPEVSE